MILSVVELIVSQSRLIVILLEVEENDWSYYNKIDLVL